MMYLSKGIIRIDGTKDIITVARGSRTINLKGIEAELWLRGRFTFATTSNQSEETALRRLEELELIECESDETQDARYSILTRCVCCVAQVKPIRVPLGASEKNIVMALMFLCRLWPLILLGILCIFGVVIAMIIRSLKDDKPLPQEPHKQPIIRPASENDVRRLAYGIILRRITELLLADYPGHR